MADVKVKTRPVPQVRPAERIHRKFRMPGMAILLTHQLSQQKTPE
jgi:hypothetical protein